MTCSSSSPVAPSVSRGTRRWIPCETWAGYGEVVADDGTGADRSDASTGTGSEHSRCDAARDLHHLEARHHPLLARSHERGRIARPTGPVSVCFRQRTQLVAAWEHRRFRSQLV